MRSSWLLMLTGFIVCSVLAGCGGPSFKGEPRKTVTDAPDFTLEDQNGRPFKLSEQRNNVVLLFFGYTYCPDVCPTTLTDFREVHRLLGSDAGKVRFVYVTVDPERDTPERLKQYVNIFNPSFYGLSGKPEVLEPVYQAYQIVHEKVTPEGTVAEYFINHTASVAVIDRDGKWRLNEPYGTNPDDIVHDIRLLLGSESI